MSVGFILFFGRLLASEHRAIRCSFYARKRRAKSCRCYPCRAFIFRLTWVYSLRLIAICQTKVAIGTLFYFAHCFEFWIATALNSLNFNNFGRKTTSSVFFFTRILLPPQGAGHTLLKVKRSGRNRATIIFTNVFFIKQAIITSTTSQAIALNNLSKKPSQ